MAKLLISQIIFCAFKPDMTAGLWGGMPPVSCDHIKRAFDSLFHFTG